MSAQLEIFSGWKEVANYLGKGVRTVQRYEHQLALPIHRPAGKPAGSVIATKKELDDWVNASPTQVDSMPKCWPTERTNRIGAEFLQVDAEIALTFCGIALTATNNEKRSSASHTARKAYDTIMRLRKGLNLTDAQRGKLDTNLQRVKSELQSLGQSF